MFYDTIVFHQNMLIGGYDDRSYTEILQPFFSASAASRHRFHPNIPVMLHFLHPSIRFSAASGKTAVSDLLLKSELLRFFYLLAASRNSAPIIPAMPAAAENLRPVLAYTPNALRRPAYHRTCQAVAFEQKLFYELFKQTFGLGAVEYLTQLRIKAACEALRSTTRVSEIAYVMVSRFQLQPAVPKQSGMHTPQMYRKEFQNS